MLRRLPGCESRQVLNSLSLSFSICTREPATEPASPGIAVKILGDNLGRAVGSQISKSSTGEVPRLGLEPREVRTLPGSGEVRGTPHTGLFHVLFL